MTAIATMIALTLANIAYTPPIVEPVSLESLIPAERPQERAHALERVEVASVSTPVLSALLEPQDVALMHRVRFCESGHDPEAQNPASSAAGWFQVIRGTWEWARESGVDVPPFEEGRYDRWHNTTVAAWLLYEGGGIGHWDASRGCW
jgi:hypothetical protein